MSWLKGEKDATYTFLNIVGDKNIIFNDLNWSENNIWLILENTSLPKVDNKNRQLKITYNTVNNKLLIWIFRDLIECDESNLKVNVWEIKTDVNYYQQDLWLLDINWVLIKKHLTN